MNRKLFKTLALVLTTVMLLAGCKNTKPTSVYVPDKPSETTESHNESEPSSSSAVESSRGLPPLQASDYSGSPSVEVNDNVPYFTADELTTTSFESYSELDNLNRCGVAFACIGTDLMPTEERGSIGNVKPSGWHTANYNQYPGLIDGNYLYNRCHLIAYMLSGENANEKNLITGTRYLNIEGMLPYEDEVHDYLIANPNNHVMYRVTPIFKGENLVAEGVLMEAYSVEDNGKGVQFCIFAYNVQPWVVIDYETGDNAISPDYDGPTLDDTQSTSTSETDTSSSEPSETSIAYNYVIDESTQTIHTPGCSCINDIDPLNITYTTRSFEGLQEDGYKPCSVCHPE